jgi:hypothetical protein
MNPQGVNQPFLAYMQTAKWHWPTLTTMLYNDHFLIQILSQVITESVCKTQSDIAHYITL